MRRVLILIISVLIYNSAFSNDTEIAFVDSILRSERYFNLITYHLNSFSDLNPVGFLGNKNFSDFKVLCCKEEKDSNDYTVFALAQCENYYVIEDSIFPQKSKVGILVINLQRGYSKGSKEYRYGFQTEWILSVDKNEISAKIILDTLDSIISCNIITMHMITERLDNLDHDVYQTAYNYFINEKYIEESGYTKRFTVNGPKVFVDIDFIQIIGGDMAYRKAKEKGIDIMYDMLILNESMKIRTYELSDTVKINLVYPYGHVEPAEFNLEGFFKIKADNPAYNRDILANFKIKNGIVVQIDEIYTP
ncbi:hypothetical protein [Saccharicrinis sp. FJH54]|uniref:hypothetical protein n=1 Tax=Saccharicrinis sp. FJH54 TaxID=3344665 RepID=UPI0035D43B8D